MELVTPYVTTAMRDFKISPITDVAARIMTAKAKAGATLADAFKAGMRNTLELDIANILMLNDTTVYLNALKGAIKSDNMYYGAQSLDSRELLTGLEYFGVMFDLPAQDVWRVVAAAGENSYPLATVDGAGNAINVGGWVGGSFDPTAPVTLKALMNAKTPAALKVNDPVSGTQVAPRVAGVVNKYLILDFFVDNACFSGNTGLLEMRYPYYALDINGQVPQAECDAASQRLTDLQARIATNNSSNP
jgi:hypothetical protein